MAEPASKGSFVARIWLEGRDDGEQFWRGHIQHVQGRQEAYFHDLGEMSAFMEQVSGVPGPATGDPASDDREINRMKRRQD